MTLFKHKICRLRNVCKHVTRAKRSSASCLTLPAFLRRRQTRSSLYAITTLSETHTSTTEPHKVLPRLSVGSVIHSCAAAAALLFRETTSTRIGLEKGLSKHPQHPENNTKNMMHGLMQPTLL